MREKEGTAAAETKRRRRTRRRRRSGVTREIVKDKGEDRARDYDEERDSADRKRGSGRGRERERENVLWQRVLGIHTLYTPGIPSGSLQDLFSALSAEVCRGWERG